MFRSQIQILHDLAACDFAVLTRAVDCLVFVVTALVMCDVRLIFVCVMLCILVFIFVGVMLSTLVFIFVGLMLRAFLNLPRCDSGVYLCRFDALCFVNFGRCSAVCFCAFLNICRFDDDVCWCSSTPGAQFQVDLRLSDPFLYDEPYAPETDTLGGPTAQAPAPKPIASTPTQVRDVCMCNANMGAADTASEREEETDRERQSEGDKESETEGQRELVWLCR